MNLKVAALTVVMALMSMSAQAVTTNITFGTAPDLPGDPDDLSSNERTNLFNATEEVGLGLANEAAVDDVLSEFFIPRNGLSGTGLTTEFTFTDFGGGIETHLIFIYEDLDLEEVGDPVSSQFRENIEISFDGSTPPLSTGLISRVDDRDDIFLAAGTQFSGCTENNNNCDQVIIMKFALGELDPGTYTASTLTRAVTGSGNTPEFVVAALVGVVPLPATVWMLLAALGGLAAVGRRRVTG